MKIVIAPDSFKESLSAMAVAEAIEKGFREIYPDADYVKVPMADGGEGTVQSMVEASGGRYVDQWVQGPLGQPVAARWGMLGDSDTAVIEMAAASGLHHVSPELRNPLNTTSYGTGELIVAALERGVKRIILGIGGSATNDGGAGMMQALGVILRDKQGRSLSPGGEALAALASIDLSGCHPLLRKVSITVACDVNNPLCGPQGASAIFGPQKGATAEMVNTLDAALENWGRHIYQATGREVINAPGAGAAGGMGAALLGLLNAELRAGVEIVVETLQLEQAVKDADLVITGEGRLDSQSICGKTPIGVARVAKRYHKPVIALAGGLQHDHHVVYQQGIDAALSILSHIVTLPEALHEAEYNLSLSARNVAAIWRLARQPDGAFPFQAAHQRGLRLLRVFFQPVQHHIMVIAGFKIIKDVFNLTISVNQKADAVNAVIRFAHKRLFAPDAELFTHLMVFIGQKGKVQQLFFSETGEFFRFIGADAQHVHACFFELVHVIA